MSEGSKQRLEFRPDHKGKFDEIVARKPDMAHEMGMSETMIGQMERGKKPIERRTALAAHYLAEHPEGITPPE